MLPPQPYNPAGMFLTAETDFGVNMLRQGAVDQSLVVSPISVIFALAMVQAGAKGTTKSQITSLISKGSSDATIQNYYANLSSQVLNAKEDVKAKIANGFFLNKQYTILKSYEETITKKYSAKVQSLDFSQAEATAKTIDNFINATTEGKINNMVKADMVRGAFSLIVNAIYFFGKWLIPFDSKLTAKGTFFSGNKKNRMVDFMNAKQKRQPYAEDADLQLLSLPYKDTTFAFNILLPKKKYGLNDLRAKLTGARIQALLSQLKSTYVTYTIPKMNIETEFPLKKALIAMGATDMFSSKADLTGITKSPPLMVSDATHRALIEVDEGGTTAAAATVIVMTRTSSISVVDPIIFKADHPFWFILTKDNNPLFIGQYV
ncbi:hypothetical protein Q1695_004133 [Nippostrongylus brasiliensis]|nr:hypothetical protein Q1695_004133 [Nippostrongylus brasiliensis]